MQIKTVFLLFVLCFGLVIFPVITVDAQPNTIVVPDDYPTIQEALFHSSDGDQIFVKKGIYEIVSEDINNTLLLGGLKVNKTLSIIGEDPTNTVLVFPPDTRMGFPLLFSTKMGFVIHANDFTISNVTIENCDFGIHLTGNGGTISNIITSSIFLEGNYTTISKTQRIVSDVYQFPARFEGCFNSIVQNEGFEMECFGSYNNFRGNTGVIDVNGDFNLITAHKNLAELELMSSNFNQITNNSILYLRIADSSNNTICGNRIEGQRYTYGLLMGSGSGNVFCGNIIANFDYDSRYFGMRFGTGDSIAENNTFYHNNFINNYNHVGWVHEIAGSGNYLDNGLEGNYWDDYEGIDSDGDGIGDTPYFVAENHQDNYPLMAPISVFDAGTWEWVQYNVDVLSNFSVSGFRFISEEKLVHFDVDSKTGAVGFSRVTIPKDLLNVTGNNWNVLFINGSSTNVTISEDPNNTYLYLNYDHNVTSIDIYGTTAIPEFPPEIILYFFAITSLLIVLCQKRISKRRQTTS